MVVSDKLISQSLRELMKKDKLGATKENETIVLDYGGPNVAKPLHVGHLRPAIIGQAIYNILKFKGNKTIGDVHLGDIGAQMGQVIYGIIQDFPNIKYEDITFDDYVKFLNGITSETIKNTDFYTDHKILSTKELQKLESDKMLYFFLSYNSKLVLANSGEKDDEKSF